MQIPKALKFWFKFHFIVDILFAFPLIVLPEQTLLAFGFVGANAALARIIGAALIGIGATSYYTHTDEEFNLMLSFKIWWSISAIAGLFWSWLENPIWQILLLIGIFIIFSGTWIYFKLKYFKV